MLHEAKSRRIILIIFSRLAYTQFECPPPFTLSLLSGALSLFALGYAASGTPFQSTTASDVT